MLAEGVAVEYERTGRRQRPLEVIVSLAAADAAPVVELTGDYFQRATIESVSPRPEAEEAIDGGVRYRFTAPEAGAIRITFRLSPQHAGRRAGEVRAGGHALAISMFVYP
jgi:hypothetical protein